ncbi:MAG TPA: ATP-binding cassette domain-containing protein [Actinomycetes bacterium]|nr:ATP-binding cassette domain-containing protein [Actinomycetes bacterium]
MHITESEQHAVPQPLVDLTQATLGYDGRAVLRDVDLSISPGEFVAVVGPNGAGKSTLIKAMLGLASVDAGTIELFGTPGTRGRSRIGYVPQRQTVSGALPTNVYEVVASGCLADGRWTPLRRSDHAATARALKRLSLDQLAYEPVTRLSGGQQRRVLIARALVRDVELLLLDEPTAGVDVDAQADLADALDALAIGGTTIVVVTHELAPFEQSLTRVVWVNRGRVEYDGPPTASILSATSEPFAHHHSDPPPDRGLLEG